MVRAGLTGRESPSSILHARRSVQYTCTQRSHPTRLSHTHSLCVSVRLCLLPQARFNPPVWVFVSFLVCFIFGLGQAYEDWSIEDTQLWLRKIGLDRELGPGFELNEYDGKALEVSTWAIE